MLASEFTEEINHALGIHPNQSGGSYNRALKVLNLSGEFLVVTKTGGWDFLAGGVADVEIGETGIGPLPSDFSKLISAYQGGSGVYLSTPDTVLGRGEGFAVTFASTPEGLMPHMVSGSGSASTLRITYIRGWVKLTASDDLVAMPEFMRPLLLEVCRQYASGLEGVDGQNPDMSKVQAVLRSDLYRGIAEYDGSAQYDLGAFGNPESMANPAVNVPLVWPLPS